MKPSPRPLFVVTSYGARGCRVRVYGDATVSGVVIEQVRSCSFQLQLWQGQRVGWALSASAVGCQSGHQRELGLLLPPCPEPFLPRMRLVWCSPRSSPRSPQGVRMFVTNGSFLFTLLFVSSCQSLKARFGSLDQYRTMTSPSRV